MIRSALRLTRISRAKSRSRPMIITDPTELSVNTFSDDLTGRKLEAAVWECGSFRATWAKLNELMSKEATTSNIESLEMLRQFDLVALACASARAEFSVLLDIFPQRLRELIVNHEKFSADTIEELFVHFGQPIEFRSVSGTWVLPSPTWEEVRHISRAVGKFSSDGRACINGTLHRVSRWAGRDGETLGFTIRVGRFVPNAATALTPLLSLGSVLILSKPGMGKTTLLRDMASSIARNSENHRVIVVDTSNEIGGDTRTPLPFFGRARRLQVSSRDQQGKVIQETIQNHTPDYVIIDEIADEVEAQAAWSMSQRGIRMVATVHGETLDKVLSNKAVHMVVGGVSQAFLSNEERRLRGKVRKTILERPYTSPFEFVLEMTTRVSGNLFFKVNDAVDAILDERDPRKDPSVCLPIQINEPFNLARLAEAPPRDMLLQYGIDQNGYITTQRESAQPKDRRERPHHQRPTLIEGGPSTDQVAPAQQTTEEVDAHSNNSQPPRFVKRDHGGRPRFNRRNDLDALLKDLM